MRYDCVLCGWKRHPIQTHEKHTRDRTGNNLHNNTTEDGQAWFQTAATNLDNKSPKYLKFFMTEVDNVLKLTWPHIHRVKAD